MPNTLNSSRSLHRPPPGLFTNRGFMLLWAAYGVSAMGDHIAELAVLKQMNAMEDPNVTRLYAMILFVFMLPFFVFGPINGILADRLPRRALMVFADLVRAVLFFNFAYLITKFAGFGESWADVPVVGDVLADIAPFIPFMLIGVFAALFSPARLSLLPNLIQPAQLVRANAMTGGLGVIATMVAAVVGGYLADNHKPWVAYYADAMTFIGSAALLLLIRVPPRDRTKAHHGGLIEGAQYVFAHRRVMQLIILAVVVWFCGSVVRSTIPALTFKVYGRTEFIEISYFQAALGVGILAGSLILTALGHALRSEAALSWSMTGIGLSVFLLVLSVFLPIPPAVRYWIGIIAVMFSGLFGAGVMASYNALLQRIVPNRLRGRVFGLADLATMAGLLLATGALGIPRNDKLDNYIGLILLFVALIATATGLLALIIRLRAGRYGMRISFWRNFVEFYSKWWFRLEREGICTVPSEGPVMIVANHVTPIDPLLLIGSTPNRVMSFMVAQEYSNLTFGRYFTKMIDCIPVTRSGEDLAATRGALRHLKDGKALGIFIEGKIAKPGETLEPKDGPALIALRTGATVIPAFISGTNYTESIVKSFLIRHNARVRYGKPIDLSVYRQGRPDKETVSEVSRLLISRIRELGTPEPLNGGSPVTSGG
jgi:1-acyl-sn-glycerol-3-phosphate acyltransferase